MTDPLLRAGSSGSITGFDAIDLDQTGTVEESRPTPFSMAELLHEFSMAKRSLNPQYLRLLSRTIEEHILNTDNPHKVTLQDLSQDIQGDILATIVPGTPPVSDPTMVLDPTWVSGSFYRTTPVVVTNALGRLEMIPAHTVAITHVDNRAGFLMTHQTTNYVTTTDAQEIIVASTIPGAVLSHGSAPLDGHSAVTLMSTTAGVQTIGVEIAHAVVTGLVSIGICIRPTITTGVITLRNRTDALQRIVYDVATRTIVDATYIDHTRVETLSNGWVRITGAFNFMLPSDDPVLLVTATDTRDVDTLTVATAGDVIVDLCFPTVVVGSAWSPIILKDTTYDGTVGDTLITVESGLTTPTEYMAVVRADAAYLAMGHHGFLSMGPWCLVSFQSGGIQADAHGVIDLRGMTAGLGDASCVVGYTPGVLTAATATSILRTASAPLTSGTVMTIGPFTGVLYEALIYPTAPEQQTHAFFLG